MGEWCSISISSPIPQFLLLISVTEGKYPSRVYGDLLICRSFLGVPYIEVLTVLLEKIVQMLRNNPNIIVAVATLPLVCLVHPAIGLGLLLLSHAFHAHSTLCRFDFNF